jgi:uncharacterized membrane protein YfcA
MEIYLWICLILFFAAFTQGVAGFGSALTALPLLTVFLDIKTAIPLVGLFSLSVTTLLVFQLLKYLEWRKIYSLILGAIAGIPIGVFFLKRLDKDTIQWTLGIFLIVYSIYSLSYKLSRNGIREAWAYFYGFLGGCLGGALSTPGPPVVVYTSLQSWSKDKIKATLQGFLLISYVTAVLAQAVSGATTVTVLRYYVISLPALTLGTYGGSYFYGKISEEWYRRIMLILLACLGAFMLYRAM